MDKQRIIEGLTRNLIMEYGGVSDDVKKVADAIFSFLVTKGNAIKWSRDASGTHKKFTIDLKNTFVQTIDVDLFAYDSSKYSYIQASKYFNDNGFLDLSFHPLFRSIDIHIVWPYNGQIDSDGKNYITSALNHELKHAFQDKKLVQAGKTSGFVPTEEYFETNKSVKTGNKANDDIIYKIQRCYYYFTKFEVDAYLQEIYSDLLHVGKLEKCRGYKVYQTVYDYYDFVKMAYGNDQQLFAVLLSKALGDKITVNRFFRYCESGRKRFEEHLKRVVGRFSHEKFFAWQ